MIISFALVWALLELFVVEGRLVETWSDPLLIGAILFGLSEVPRLEDVPSGVVRTVLLLMTVLLAVVYIAIVKPGSIRNGVIAGGAFIIVSVFAATITTSGSTPGRDRLASEEIRETVPYFAVFGIGLGLSLL